MNDQDRDLIAALAQGDLSTTAAEEATALIEADPELASEYANQIAAIDFLDSATTPMMTAEERSTLHSNLTEQLGLLPATSPIPVESKKKTQWWVPVFGFATAAAVVAAFVIFPGSSQDTFTEVSANLDSEVETLSEPSEASPQASAGSTQTTAPASDTQESGTAGDSAVAEAPTGVDDSAFSVYETDSVALDELLNQADGATSPESVQRQLSEMSFKTLVELSPDEVNACLNGLEAELPDGVVEILVIGADVEDGETIIHVGFDYGEGIEDGMSFVLETCQLVEHSPQG